MKKGVYQYIIAVFAVLAVACTGGEKRGNVHEATPTDTVYTEKAVLEIYGSDPERALAMIDSGVLVGNIAEERATFLRATVYSHSSDEWPLDTVSQMLEGLLESDYAQKDPGNRQNVLDLLVYVSRRRGDDVAYLHWATVKADFCRQRGEETEALRTEAEIGAVLTCMGEVEKGISKIDGVIGALDKQRHFNEMDACIIALKRKIHVLCDLDRYDEVIPLAKRMVEKINDYRDHPDDYNDGSFRLLPNEEKRRDYCNFYTSQAYGFLTIAYSDLISESRNSNSEVQHSNINIRNYQDSARHYLALFMKSDYSNTLEGKMMLADAFLRLGQYSKMQPLYDEIEARMGADTLNSDYAIILHGRAVMAEAAGNYYAANNYGKRYNNLKDALNKQLLESRAYEYAARYHLQEEKMRAENGERMVKISRRMVVALFVFALAAIGFIVRLLFRNRAIDRKNKVLAEQLAEIIKNEELRIKSEETAPDGSKFDIQNSKLTELSDEQLFEYLSEVIRAERLFTDPNFGRQTLADRFHLSDRRIGAAFAKGSKYASITEFTRALRLEYACQLPPGVPT